MVTAMPKSLLAVFPLAFFYLHIQNYFLRTSRDLNILETKTSSLVYTHLQSVYTGISTIRAFRHGSRFEREMAQYIDTDRQVYCATCSVNHWL